MTLQTKLGIAALTLGSGGVATYAALVPKVSGTKISKLMDEKFRHILLDTKDGADNEEWSKKWNSYKTENSENIFGLDNWDKKNSQDLRNELRKKCKELAETEVQSRADNLYENVTKYCARDVTIADQAKRDNLDLIKTDENSATTWDKVALKKEKLATDFTNLGIEPETNKSYIGTKVKEKCEAATNKHKGENNYETIYNSYKKVCVTEAAKPEEGGVGA